MRKRYVLFDFDGVVADTEMRNKEYMQKALAVFGITLTNEDCMRLVGRRDKELLEEIFARGEKVVTMEMFLEQKEKVGNSYEDGTIRPMPGFPEFTAALKKAGFKLGLVSSTSTKLLVSALNHMGLMDRFLVIVGGDMITTPKPSPEGYQKAMAYLGAAPEDCVIVEDSPVGIQAGKAAGAFVIGYTGSKIVQDVSEADLVLASFEDEEIIQNMTGSRI